MSELAASTPGSSSPSRTRRLAFLCGLASLTLLGASLWQMSHKVNRALAGKVRQVFMPLKDPEFTFAGREVVLTYEAPEGEGAGTPQNPGLIRVKYGDESLPIQVTIPPDAGKLQLPLITAHEDWMQVLRFTEGTAADLQRVDAKIDEGVLPDRLVIVTRIPPQGVDPSTWGRIRRKEWSFAFYEFLPEGGFRKEQLRFPTSKRYEPNRAGELAEGTWQFGAALMVMPKGTVPSPRFADDGLRAMGWTLPGAAVGASGATVCAIVFAAAGVRRRA